MRVSIVTVSFNQRRWLRGAIESVLAQDYPDIEFIVVDPGSSDGSRELIESYGQRVTRRIFEPDDGPAHGLNHGLAVATGEVFAYVNADDALLPGAVAAAVAALTRDQRCAAVVGHGWIVDGDGRPVRHMISAPTSPWLYVYGVGVVAQQSTFIRMDWVRTVGGFNLGNKVCWDAELLLEIMLAGGEVRILDEFWSIFRIYPGSITGSQKLAALSESLHAGYFRKVIGRDRRGLDALISNVLRLVRWIRQPRWAIARISDKWRGPPCVSLPAYVVPDV